MKDAKKSEDDKLSKAIEAQMAPFYEKLEALSKSLEDLANAPLPAKGVAYNQLSVLKKSQDEVEALNKSVVLDKLWELKKSSPNMVDTADITKVEIGSENDMVSVVKKYNIK